MSLPQPGCRPQPFHQPRRCTVVYHTRLFGRSKLSTKNRFNNHIKHEPFKNLKRNTPCGQTHHSVCLVMHATSCYLCSPRCIQQDCPFSLLKSKFHLHLRCHVYYGCRRMLYHFPHYFGISSKTLETTSEPVRKCHSAGSLFSFAGA